MLKPDDGSDEHEGDDGHEQYRDRQPDALKMMVRAARQLGRAALAASVCRMSKEGRRSAF